MAQYWLEIASAADLAQLEVVTTGTLSYTTDDGIPVAVFKSTTAVGEYVRLLGVPTASTMAVQALFRVTAGAFSGSRSGPAARISGGNGYAHGRITGGVYRPVKSFNGTSGEISTNLTGQPLGNTWGWMEVLASGTSLEFRSWAPGDDRPTTAQRTATDSDIASGVAGFGSPRESEATSHIRIIAIGTDGDPAPTGPVGGGRQRSRLILTPW